MGWYQISAKNLALPLCTQAADSSVCTGGFKRTFTGCTDMLYRQHLSQVPSQTGRLLFFTGTDIQPQLTLKFPDGAEVEFRALYVHDVRECNGTYPNRAACKLALAGIDGFLLAFC